MVESIEKRVMPGKLIRAVDTLRTVLAVWGVISLTATTFIIGMVFFVKFAVSFSYPTAPQYNEATVSDAEFVFKWSGLGAERIESVAYSYKTFVRDNGEHLSVYAIKVSSITADELVGLTDGYRRWTRGDLAKGVLREAVEFASPSPLSYRTQWFLDEELLLSDEVYVYPLTIDSYGYGERVDEAELVFVVPSKNLVYYVSLAE